jgi:hypothetical protein
VVPYTHRAVESAPGMSSVAARFSPAACLS